MHADAREFVKAHATGKKVDVVEIGSRDINGTVRDLFPNATYTGIDTSEGRGVDVVADGATWQPKHKVDVVVCCEVLEHVENWRDIIANAADMLRKNGELIVTCAGPGRAPHSAVDGGRLRDGEFYANVTTDELGEFMESLGLVTIVEQYKTDTYAVGVNRG